MRTDVNDVDDDENNEDDDADKDDDYDDNGQIPQASGGDVEAQSVRRGAPGFGRWHAGPKRVTRFPKLRVVM